MYLPLAGTFLAESGITLAIASVEIRDCTLPLDGDSARKFIENELKPFLSQKKDPPDSWMKQYKTKRIPELTQDEKLLKTLLENHARCVRRTKGNDVSVLC